MTKESYAKKQVKNNNIDEDSDYKEGRRHRNSRGSLINVT
jgi:hypothetical protein